MAATATATTAGLVLLVLYVLSRRFSSSEEEPECGGDRTQLKSRSAKKRLQRRPAQAPATWLETMSTLSETLRFTYAETFGKWPIGDLAFGIKYFIQRQGNLQVASVYAGEESVQLNGAETIDQLYYYLRLLTLCMLFSKKPFHLFLESAGFSEAHVLLQKPKAAPAFTVLRDENSKCFLLLIRGTHSIKDTLTAALGAVVPFHHSVLHDGGISNLVLGYAHCGMVAAARWIAKLSTPTLLKALEQNPDYDVKIVGHSLGGGTAALLTYILREQKEFSASTCVTFAPAACMTWELAESGKHFITTIINGSDLVPTFSVASVDDLRSEVTSSSWLSDLRDQVEQNRVLKIVYHSAIALGSCLASMSNAKARVAGAGAFLRPVSSSTQVVMKHAQDVAQAVVGTRSSISSWTCIGPRRRAVVSSSNSKTDDLPEFPLIIAERASETLIMSTDSSINRAEYHSLSSGEYGPDEIDEDGDLIRIDKVIATSSIEEITEGELWHELEMKLNMKDSEGNSQIPEEEEEDVVNEIIEEEKLRSDALDSQTPRSLSDVSDSHHFYPPGKIMHIVSIPSSEPNNPGFVDIEEERVGIYETSRELYSKLRLSRTMIKDHFMPMYKNMMELLIVQLENELDSSILKT
ncbi:uncharacterized protein [Henckelia pumila]|uniref:uncharacterized protein isoform X2 n=1 Tax=Henckelia pumila TaxID=405737 RepID=UPI003C6E547E